METRKPLDAYAMGLMLLLCLTWGAQQIALKATAEDCAPVMQIALRSGMAALLVGLWMAWRRERISRDVGLWKPGLVAGAFFSLEYLLLGEGLRHTSAAHMVVFLYTAPIFAAVGLHFKLPAERLAPLQWLGIALAFSGIAVAFLMRTASSTGADWGRVVWGDLLGLLAGAAWGATTVAVRTTRLSSLPAAQTLLYQLVVAFVVLLPVAVLSGHGASNPTPRLWAGLVFQVVAVSFASFLVWFWLLRKYLASRLGVFSFLTPLFGVALGAWLLHEAVEPSFLAGALLVLIGVFLVSGHGWLAQRLRRNAVPPTAEKMN